MIYVEYKLKSGETETVCYDCGGLNIDKVIQDLPNILKEDGIDYAEYKVTKTLTSLN